MTYVVNYADATKTAINVEDRDVDTASLPITLYGKGALNYGEGIQENILHILENFASPTEPVIKTQGMLWYDTTTKKLKLFDLGTWKDVGSRIEVGETLPTNPAAGTAFYRTTDTYFAIFDGNAWVEVALKADLAAHMADDTRHLTSAQQQQLLDLTGINAALISAMQTEINKRVKIAGDTMTGFLTLHAAPQQTMHAANKGYVDSEIYKLSRQMASDGIEYLYSDSFTTFAAPNQTTVGLPFQYQPGQELMWVFVGGLRMASTTFTEASNSTIVFNSQMVADTELSFEKFNKGRLNPPSTKGLVNVDTFETTIAAPATDVVIPVFVPAKNRVFVWRNGVKARLGVDFTEVGTNTIRFTSQLSVGDFIQVTVFTLENGAEIRLETMVATSNGQQQLIMATPYYLNPTDRLDPLNQDVLVFAAGVYQGKDSLVESDGTKIVLADGIQMGTVVEVFVFMLP